MDYGVRLLRFDEYPVVPWRNGRGVTREVAAGVVAGGTGVAGVVAGSTRGAGTGAVGAGAAPAWRISMATIDEPAPFSQFPGRARTLGIIGGEGIELTVDGRMQPLRPGDVFGPFSGELPASARPIDGPALDLGLMLDPGRVQGEMRAVGAGEHDLVGLTWFVVSLVDELTFALNHGDPIALSQRDTAALDLRAGPIARLTLAAVASGPLAYLVSISR